MRALCVAVAVGLPGMAAAQDFTDAATGAVYVLAAQADGTATLTLGADEDVHTLRTDCFATHMIYGVGLWKSDPAGWHIDYGGTTFLTFADQPQPFEGVDCSKGPVSGG